MIFILLIALVDFLYNNPLSLVSNCNPEYFFLDILTPTNSDMGTKGQCKD